jgi:hypothetical protein
MFSITTYQIYPYQIDFQNKAVKFLLKQEKKGTGPALKVGICDLDLWPQFMEMRWHPVREYFWTNRDGRKYAMHHLVLKVEPDPEYPVHHLNGKPWDNRRSNLIQLHIEQH